MACIYNLQFANESICVTVENSLTKDIMEFMDNIEISPVPDTKLGLIITGKELDKLRKWGHWIEGEANTSRYIYRFGRVAMGRFGFTVKVTDTQALPITIDITDYEDW